MFWLVEVFLFKKIHTFGELLSVLLFICGKEKFIYFIPFTEQSISCLIWYSAAIESRIHLSPVPNTPWYIQFTVGIQELSEFFYN